MTTTIHVPPKPYKIVDPDLLSLCKKYIIHAISPDVNVNNFTPLNYSLDHVLRALKGKNFEIKFAYSMFEYLHVGLSWGSKYLVWLVEDPSNPNTYRLACWLEHQPKETLEKIIEILN
jgi:hypothetical protein